MGLFFRTLLLLTFALALSACSLPRGAAIMQEVVHEKDQSAPSFQVVEVTRAELPRLAHWPMIGSDSHYHWPKKTRGPSGSIIRSGDVVDLVIWESDDNSLLTDAGQKSTKITGLTVSPSGTIFVPYLDDVVVAGMSVSDARANIQKRLNMISPSAQVHLNMTAGVKNSVDLVTGVPKPGTFPLPDRNYTILSLLSQGGGIKRDLRNPLVRLIRGSHNYSIRAEELFENQNRNIVLRGGDKVLVREDERFFTALGATGSEKLVYFEKENITAMEALSMVGGLSDFRANLKAVLVLRTYSAKQVGAGPNSPDMNNVVFAFDLTNADGLFAAKSFQIQPDDTVMATESAVNAVRVLFGLIGSVFGLADAAGS